jgi:acetyl esterase/lipase
LKNISISENITVKRQSGIDLNIDVYDGVCPTSDSQINILLLPGGSWLTANYKPLAERFAIPLATLGYRCITAQYSVATEAIWPAQIQDVKDLLEWLDDTVNLSESKDKRTLIAGKSAGGHLALMSPIINELPEGAPRIAGTVGIAPVINIGSAIARDDIAKILGPDPSNQSIRDASPLEHISPDYPPTLLIHGTDDDRVNHASTLEMFQLLEECNVPTDLLLLAGKGHSFDSEPEISKLMVSVIDLFISRYIS